MQVYARTHSIEHMTRQRQMHLLPACASSGQLQVDAYRCLDSACPGCSDRLSQRQSHHFPAAPCGWRTVIQIDTRRWELNERHTEVGDLCTVDHTPETCSGLDLQQVIYIEYSIDQRPVAGGLYIIDHRPETRGL